MRLLLASPMILALAGCGRAEAEANEAVAGNVAAPAFDQRIDAETAGGVPRLVVLCDPVRFRISLRHSADATSLDPSYPRRTIISPEALVQRFPHQGGGDQYQDSLIRYERCGPFVIRLQGEFLNGNLDGEMGGFPPFAAFRIWADNRMVFPTDGRSFVRLAVCDAHLPRFDNCPGGYAVRVDIDYRPDVERVSIREWARTEDVLGGEDAPRTIDRESEVQARLGMWWNQTHAEAPADR